MTQATAVTMDGEWSGADWAAMSGSVLAGLGLLGAAFKFVVTWFGGRQEKRLAELERQMTAQGKQVAVLTNQLQAVAYYGMAMHAKLTMHAPESPELAEWDRVMRTIYPLVVDTPADLLRRTIRLDEGS